jgi:pimeloyl-ACP methyl ester carboxylesterase
VPVAHVNGADLYYEEHGVGTPILGIHGTPSSSLLWVDAAEKLAEYGRCIIYDRRGFSRSVRPEPFEEVDLVDHVDDAVALLEALTASPAIVIGRSTGGQIALELARRFPDLVSALCLLEPALFSIDPVAAVFAEHLREQILGAAASDPSAAAEVLIREALGNDGWESLPPALRAMFTSASPAVLAEVRGHGLDLSAHPLALSDDDLASLRQPTLLVSATDSPVVLRLINDRLAAALPHSRQVRVEGGHLIDPAHPAVVEFISMLPPPSD